MDAADRADLELFRSPKAESGWKNVYVAHKTGHGALTFVAKVKAGRRLRALPNSRGPEAWRVALHVLRWYRSTYGPLWRAVLASRKRNPFRVWQSLKWGGYLACVWYRGRRREVVGETGDLRMFPTREDAACAARAFAEGLVGGSLWGCPDFFRT